MRQRICLAISTKNEAKALPKFLKHHAWADEILLLDSFSTDATIDICKQYGRKFHQQELAGNANNHANLALSLSDSDWVFCMDPDEFISERLKEEVLSFLENKDNKYVAYESPRINYFMDKPLEHGGWSGYSLKIFRKGCVEFKGNSFHERATVKGAIGRLTGEVIHYPNPNIHWFIEKFNYISEFDLNVYYERYGVLSMRKFKWLLISRPLKIFWKCYFKKQGYKDGLEGLTYAVLIWAFDIIRICKYGERYIIKNPHVLTLEKLPDPWECRKT